MKNCFRSGTIRLLALAPAATIVGMLAVPVSQARAGLGDDIQAADARGDYATELRLLQPLVQAGNAGAQVFLANLYERGHGVPKDDREAARLYQQAAEHGFAAAQSILGAFYVNGRRGIPKNDAEAVRWFRKAAVQGYAPGQTHLGLMYALGWGVPMDKLEAARWQRKAAEQGYSQAQFLLGDAYLHGVGVPNDYAQAYMWFSLAAAHGDKEAPKYRDDTGRLMTPEQIAEAQRLAATWRPRASPWTYPDPTH